MTSLQLGGITYTQSQLLTIMSNPRLGDASVILAVPLIAVKLDFDEGSNPTVIGSTMNHADGLLTGLTVPANVKPSSKQGVSMIGAAVLLDLYANGLLTPGCTP